MKLVSQFFRSLVILLLFSPFVLIFWTCSNQQTNQKSEIEATKGYEDIANRLSEAIDYEIIDKLLPAVAIVLVDDQEIVWAKSFGHRDLEKQRPNDLRTRYRVGSVSKLLTNAFYTQGRAFMLWGKPVAQRKGIWFVDSRRLQALVCDQDVLGCYTRRSKDLCGKSCKWFQT